MSKQQFKRRDFIRSTAMASIALSLPGWMPVSGKRIGIIGLDTSHSIAFTKWFNRADAGPETGGYKVVCAYPHGSRDIASSVARIAPNTEEMRQLGVKITDSIAALLQEVDVVCLETNDGRLHLEQAMEVFKAGKPVFIDKPIAASLNDTLKIFTAAQSYGVPVFSSSSLRYTANTRLVAAGNFGKVLGADTFSPATIEKTHPDLFWYGIHGVEMLFAVMGTGCREVQRVTTAGTDLVIGTWHDGRIGCFRGSRNGKADFGGTAFCEKENVALGPFTGYAPLLEGLVKFFQTATPPVAAADTIEIIAFMEAAEESKKQNGKTIPMEIMMNKAGRSTR